MTVSAPKVLLVAAVSGMPPSDLHSTLQQTLEDVYGLLLDDIEQYKGDNAAFVDAEPYLRNCLLSEVNPKLNEKKKPYSAIVAVVALLTLAGIGIYSVVAKQMLLSKIDNLPTQSGFYVQSAKWYNGELHLTILRDPAAISISEWQSANALNQSPIKFNELSYASLDKEIIEAKVMKAIGNRPLSFQLVDTTLSVSGVESSPLQQKFIASLLAIPGVNNLNIEQVSTALPQQKDSQLAALKQYINKLASYQIDFSLKSSKLDTAMETQVSEVASHIRFILQLAQQLDVSVGVIISGYSDSSGNAQQNQVLSENRAEQVKAALVASDVDEKSLYAVGVGELPIETISSAARKVIFSGILLTAKERELSEEEAVNAQ